MEVLVGGRARTSPAKWTRAGQPPVSSVDPHGRLRILHAVSVFQEARDRGAPSATSEARARGERRGADCGRPDRAGSGGRRDADPSREGRDRVRTLFCSAGPTRRGRRRRARAHGGEGSPEEGCRRRRPRGGCRRRARGLAVAGGGHDQHREGSRRGGEASRKEYEGRAGDTGPSLAPARSSGGSRGPPSPRTVSSPEVPAGVVTRNRTFWNTSSTAPSPGSWAGPHPDGLRRRPLR